jgi:hypothetical protein
MRKGASEAGQYMTRYWFLQVFLQLRAMSELGSNLDGIYMIKKREPRAPFFLNLVNPVNPVRSAITRALRANRMTRQSF